MTTNNATYPPPQPAVKTIPMNITVPPPRRNDNQITHAWSIGTTRIAKEAPQPRRKEECPPEVYIG
jgi:hypothetical protein